MRNIRNKFFSIPKKNALNEFKEKKQQLIIINNFQILLFGTIGLIVSGLLSTFANDLIFFTIARFFVMFFVGGKHRLIKNLL